jgi:hypothetical protein
MKNTSCGCDCPFVKQGFCSSEKECPNYVESWWIEGQTQEQVLIKDCSPKRMLYQQQIMQSRLETLQNRIESQQLEYIKLSGYLSELITMSKQVIMNESKQVEQKECHEKVILQLPSNGRRSE